MTLIRTGQGITDIRGGFGGVCFTRDKSGLHCSAKPRRVAQGTPKQQKQRKAFMKARAACLTAFKPAYTPGWLDKCVSFYIYQAMNDLPFIFDCIVTGNPDPDCRGTYELTGVHGDKDYYKRTDSVYFLWYWSVSGWWYITRFLGSLAHAYWFRKTTMEGSYDPEHGATGNPIVKLELRPPPPDYNPSKL